METLAHTGDPQCDIFPIQQNNTGILHNSAVTLSLVLHPLVLPPGSVQFDTETGEVVQLLHVEALPKAVNETVLSVQAKAHGPQDLCVFLAQVIKGVHQLLQVRMGVHHVSCQDVVETMCGAWETLLHLRTPDELGDLETEVIEENTNTMHQPLLTVGFLKIKPTG